LGALQRFALALATPALYPTVLGPLVLGLALGLAGPAHAQLSASAGLQSDYRYRGISLSSGLLAATVDVAYDHASGVYAGASAIGAVVDGRARSLGFIEYLGYATPRRHGLSWDVGVNNQDLAYYADKRYALKYTEVYVGAVGDNLSAHLHYSSNYLRPGYGALYAEVDGSLKPAENWRLFAHLGSNIPVGDTVGRRARYDARAGVARQFGRFEVQASVTATTPDPPSLTPHHRTALVVGANWFF
jgi:uncharacterized protein (TIGR02001 family)